MTFYKVSTLIFLTNDSELRNSENYETSRTCRGRPREYNEIFFAAQIHFKRVKLSPENPAIFRFCVTTREL